MDLRRMAGLLGAVTSVVVLAGCGGGAASLPETGGVDPATYMSHFSGRWILSPETSDDLSSIPQPPPEDAGPDVPPEGSVMRPGGRRGRPGARGARPGSIMGAEAELEAARVTLRALRIFPETFYMEVGDSAVVTTWVGQDELRIPENGDPVEARVGDQQVEASAGWEGGVLQVKLAVRRGRTIVDRIEPVPEANRLLVVRTLDGFSGQVPDLRLAFNRADRR